MTGDPATTLAAALLSMPVITAKSPEDAARKRAAHQLAVLADAGYAVVQLEPMHEESTSEFPYRPKWLAPYATYTVDDGEVERVGNGNAEYMHPEDARAEAAALLAAARAAEGEVS